MKKRSIIILLTSSLIFNTSLPYAQNLGFQIEGTGFGAQQLITDTASGNSLVLQSGEGDDLKITGYNYETGTGKALYLSVDGANTILNSSGGNVGIGTTAPVVKLDVSGGIRGNNSQYIGVDGNSTSHIGVQGSSTYSVGVHGISDDWIGVVGNGATFDFDALGPGVNYGATSSIRWKTNIVNIPSPLEKLNRLRGVYFDWDEAHGGKYDIGFIAEEVGQVIPEIVVYEENGVDASGMDYSKMTPLLVEAANAMRREYLEEIAEIKKENQELKKKNQELKTRLDKIEWMLAGQDISQSQ